MGLSVIPLRPRGKEPLIKWEEFQRRLASEEEIKTWFQKWPEANIGIVTGAISNVVVVDLDGEEGIKEAERLGLSSTVISLTGNGKHLWYRHPDGNVPNAVKLYTGIDIRGEGGYIVAPPSVSPNGKRYRFLTPFMDVNTLQEFPTVLIQTKQLLEVPSRIKEQDWIAKALQEMKYGNIDNTFTSILGRMRHDGWSANDARVTLQPHADRVGAGAGHLDEKIENIWNRYEPKTGSIRISTTYEQSGLIIHSPSNPDSIKQYEQRRFANVESGLKTGFPKLDELLVGGLKSSRLFTIAARTGVGKTNFIIGIAQNLCKEGKKVLLFSTEMPYEEIWDRYKASLVFANGFDRHAFYVCDSFAPNLEKVEMAINEIKPDLFIFDHINHVSEEVKGLGEFMQGLNFLRRKYDCAGLVTAQLNRAADWVDLKTGEKVTPRISMIKGSGTIEQASSRVLLLSETRVTPEMTEIVGNLDKNDNGMKGMLHFGLCNHPWRMIEL